MISLILKHREIEAERRKNGESEESEWSERMGDLVKSDTTLLICPASLIGQWEKEVENRQSCHEIFWEIISNLSSFWLNFKFTI